MLRLPNLATGVRPTKTFVRLAIPHICLVFMVSVYLVFGALVFFYLERPHDQQVRIQAKMRLNREIRHLTTLIYYQSKFYEPPTPPFFDAAADETTPIATSTSAAGMTALTHGHSSDGSPSSLATNGLTWNDSDTMRGHGEAPFADAWRERELDRIDSTYKIEKQIYALMHHWEEAIRAYDIRASHMFTDDLVVDTRWASENVTRVHMDATESRWTFSAAVLFTFTVITTIGYGNLTPSTFHGRLFCMVYGLIGIPLTMLAIANIGRFFSEFAQLIVDKIRREFEYQRLRKKVRLNKRRASRLAGQFFQEAIKRGDIQLRPLSNVWGRVCLLVCFVSYIIGGALCLPLWEEMNFFDGCYFSFVTITTVGFGDIVPRRYDYLFPTLVYITVGLAITTLTIEIFGGFLRQVHYLGSKIKGAKNALIWFGNKMLTVQELVTAIGRQYGIPQAEIETLNFNMDEVVKETVQHREDEIRTHKGKKMRGGGVRGRRDDSKLAPLFADYEFRYIDEDSLAGTPMYHERFVLWKSQQNQNQQQATNGFPA